MSLIMQTLLLQHSWLLYRYTAPFQKPQEFQSLPLKPRIN